MAFRVEADMEAASGLTASQKLIDVAKGAPAWLLIAIVLVLSVILAVPSFYALVPKGTRPWIPLALVAAGILAFCLLASLTTARVSEQRKNTRERDRQRLIGIYRPLVALFLTRHVTTCSSTGAPRLHHRIENAAHALGHYRRWTVGVRRAFRALFDHQRSESGEVEFGGGFPLDKIVELTTTKAAVADGELLEHVRRAHRSQYGDPRNGLLTEEEIALFYYIQREHERLSRRCG
ncbi:MAG TPA: hypothetical protein VGL35_09965 [Rhizomicrobium sp.]|jgi:hypothetical protein